nr:M48 family metallopeptidase [Alteromonas sp. C1M14]
MLEPSSLSAAEQQRIQVHFSQVLANIHTQHDPFTILFRQGNAMGPNAFALPDGTIVFTDEIILLVDKQQDLLDAILLHEIGHVEHNHAMQLVAESLFTTVIISTYFGDVSGALDLFMGVGSTVVHNQFSQKHEWEADNYAISQLHQLSREPDTFAQAMKKLATLMPTTNENLSQWFSTHPHIDARIDNASKVPETP